MFPVCSSSATLLARCRAGRATNSKGWVSMVAAFTGGHSQKYASKGTAFVKARIHSYRLNTWGSVGSDKESRRTPWNYITKHIEMIYIYIYICIYIYIYISVASPPIANRNLKSRFQIANAKSQKVSKASHNNCTNGTL